MYVATFDNTRVLYIATPIRSCTSNDIYMTAGQVPETIMTGNTADISHIAEFGWYDWVMFRDLSLMTSLSLVVTLDLLLTLDRH